MYESNGMFRELPSDLFVVSAVLAAGVVHFAALGLGLEAGDILKGIAGVAFSLALGFASLGLLQRR